MSTNILLDPENASCVGCPKCNSTGKVGFWKHLKYLNGISSRVWVSDTCLLCTGVTFIKKEVAFEYKLKVKNE